MKKILVLVTLGVISIQADRNAQALANTASYGMEYENEDTSIPTQPKTLKETVDDLKNSVTTLMNSAQKLKSMTIKDNSESDITSFNKELNDFLKAKDQFDKAKSNLSAQMGSTTAVDPYLESTVKSLPTNQEIADAVGAAEQKAKRFAALHGDKITPQEKTALDRLSDKISDFINSIKEFFSKIGSTEPAKTPSRETIVNAGTTRNTDGYRSTELLER